MKWKEEVKSYGFGFVVLTFNQCINQFKWNGLVGYSENYKNSVGFALFYNMTELSIFHSDNIESHFNSVLPIADNKKNDDIYSMMKN